MKIFTIISNILHRKEVYKFALVGVGAAGSVLLITWMLTEFIHIFYMYSVAIAFELTFIWGFFVHDKWTFKEYPKKKSMIQRFFRYNIVGITALGVNETFLLLFTFIFEIYYMSAEFLAIILTFGFNYFMNKKFTWSLKFNME